MSTKTLLIDTLAANVGLTAVANDEIKVITSIVNAILAVVIFILNRRKK